MTDFRRAIEVVWLSDADPHLSTEEAEATKVEIMKKLGAPPAGASFVFTGDALILTYRPYDPEAVGYVLEVLNWRDAIQTKNI